VDLFQDEVFVFTPRATCASCPRAARTIDFAYRVHTEVGHHCIGAKVNGRMVGLETPLENGDIVEISPQSPTVQPDWLNSPRPLGARKKDPQWFKRSARERGRGKSVRSARGGIWDGTALLRRWPDFHYKELSDFFAALGYGDGQPAVGPAQAGRQGAGRGRGADPAARRRRGRGLRQRARPGNAPADHAGAGCARCRATPSRVTWTRGKGVSVHRTTASTSATPVPGAHPGGGVGPLRTRVFPVSLKIEAWDRTGLLRDIATVIRAQNLNLRARRAGLRDKAAVSRGG